MDRLKATLDNYSRWQPVIEYVDRIEAFLDTDFSISIENSKSLLESISKEICHQKGQLLNNNENVTRLLSLAFGCLGYPDSNFVRQIGKSISNIAQQIGNLRNELGRMSHGRPLDELRNRQDLINSITRDFLITATESVSCFLIEAFELDNPIISIPPEIRYDEEIEFNQYWDELYAAYQMGDYTFNASEVLFKCEPESYKLALNEYKQSPDETNN